MGWAHWGQGGEGAVLRCSSRASSLRVEPGINLAVGTDVAGGTRSFAMWSGTVPATAGNFGTLADFGVGRDYMVLAVGVPEPSGIILLALGLVTSLSRRARR